jgi:hypothetical protein
MGKQDIIQVLTPDHSVEATFLDEDATIGDLLAALSEDNPMYGNGFWAIVEVAMPRTSKERDKRRRRRDRGFGCLFDYVRLING